MRTGIYVDSDNISSSGGSYMRYETLRRFYEASSTVMIARAYHAFDEVLAEEKPEYANWHAAHVSRIQGAGFRLFIKPVKRYTNDTGTSRKGNVDVELTVEVLTQADKLDRVVLVTGDGDFVALVHALQSKGIRVEVIAFKNVSSDLVQSADVFLNGYLVPDILAGEAQPRDRVIQIMSVDLNAQKAFYTHLTQAPATFSPDDPAWVRGEIKLTKSMIDSRNFRPGKILAWRGRNADEQAFEVLASQRV
ncbi:NYN domain-containing protein [Pseudomonas duriflava]|uniref:NYN domain-containing protein n=1 Tax=Pseudomonas duriflava TaxID=459528 RepID=A0A562PS43_9PSED|nr:NYN domain-containing protein [Pseudomonas duriflava]TWI47264.1 NYN domain-containing protein [Pseudomonas duriflava]